MNLKGGSMGMRLIEEVPLDVLVVVFDTEELEDDVAPAVGMERSDERLVAAAVQPGYPRFAAGPDEGDNRQRRFAFFSGEVRSAQSLRFGEQRPDLLGIRFQAFGQRVPVTHFGYEHL